MENDEQDYSSDNTHIQDQGGNHFGHSTNISSTEIDEETEKKLRGDAIGNSLYSESFVLKTLLKFSNVEWNEQLEEDLCFLWDMTLDKDVCELLFKMSYPKLACSAIASCDENRFIEIVIGILANIFCASCEKSITEEEVRLIINVLYVEDALILIQVMRFITAVSSEFEHLNFLSEDDLVRISFILEHSINDELLKKTLETVAKITTDLKLDAAKIDGDLINSCFIAYMTLYLERECKDREIVNNFVQFMCNVCGYMTSSEDNRLRNSIIENSNMFIDEIVRILRYYTSGKHLFPLTDEFEFYAEAASYLVIVLSVGYHSSIFVHTFRIIASLLKNECPVSKSLFEIISYLLSKGELQDIKNDLKKIKISDVGKVFTFINEEKYECEYPYKETFNVLKTEFPYESV